KILHVSSFVKLCDSFVELCEIDIPQKTQRKNITPPRRKTQRKFKRNRQHLQSFVKLCDSFVELCEIDIPQKTQRKKITKNTKKNYHSATTEDTKKIQEKNVACGILCETL
ncbi:MAG: hypothetical protein ACK455_01665, partial [Bacteroidota bacterium]